MIITDYDDYLLSNTYELKNVIWAFYVAGTLLLAIIMLTLLISIIQNSYSKVSETQFLASNFEKALILFGSEKTIHNENKYRNIYFKKRFLFSISNHETNYGNNKFFSFVNSSVKKMTSKIKKLSDKILKFHEKFTIIEDHQKKFLNLINLIENNLNKKNK